MARCRVRCFGPKSLFLIPTIKDMTDEIKARMAMAFGGLLWRDIKEVAETCPRMGDIPHGMADLATAVNGRSPGIRRSSSLASTTPRREPRCGGSRDARSRGGPCPVQRRLYWFYQQAQA